MYIFHCIVVTEFELHLQNWFRVLHAVDSKKKVKKSKAIVSAVLYHADISKLYFLVCHLKIVFYFLHELKQRSGDVTGWH